MESTGLSDERSAGGAGIRKAVETAAVGLGLVGVLYVVLAVGAGLAYQARQFPGDELHRVGLVAASAVDLRIGITVVVAAVLASAAAHLNGPRHSTATRAAAVLTLTTAALSVLLAALAVRAQYHQLDLRNTSPTTAFNISQATYVVGSVGPAIVAALVAAAAGLGGGRRR